MFKKYYYKAFEKIEIHWSADGLNGADAFDEINGTKQMFAMIS